MKKIILFTLLLIGYSTCMYAQKVIEVTGLVTDAQEEPMIGVNVTVQDRALSTPSFLLYRIRKESGIGERRKDNQCGTERGGIQYSG